MLSQKITAAVLITLAFSVGLLGLKDRLTTTETLAPIQITIEVSGTGSKAPEYVRVTPDDDLQDTAEAFREVGRRYVYSTSMPVRTIAVHFFDDQSLAAVRSVEVRVGYQNFLFPPISSNRDWTVYPEKGGYLVRLKPDFGPNSLFLKFLGGKYQVMNWPGDLNLAGQVFRESGLVLGAYLVLWLLALGLIWAEPVWRPGVIQFKPKVLSSNSGVRFLVLLAVLLTIRWPTLGQVVGYDEGSFLGIAGQVARGSALYQDVWDPKAPGFLLFFVPFLRISTSLWVVHLGGLAVVAGTAVGIGSLSRQLVKAPDNLVVSWSAGFAYLFISTLQAPGWSITPEQLVTALTVWAIVLAVGPRPWRQFLAGILLGIGVTVKYTAGLEFIAVGVFWLRLATLNRTPVKSVVVGAATGCIGGLVPLAVMAFGFWTSGQWTSWWNDNVVFDLFQYHHDYSLRTFVNVSVGVIKAYWVFLVLATIGFLAQVRNKSQQAAWLLASWGLCAVVEVLSPGGEEVLYWYHLWGPLALGSSLGLLAVMRRFPTWHHSLVVSASVLALSGAVFLESDRPDSTGAVASWLAPRLSSDDRLFVVGDQTEALRSQNEAIYWQLDTPALTRWVHGSYRTDGETLRILGTKPKFIVMGGSRFYSGYRDHLQDYQEVFRFGTSVVFERKGP